MKCKKSIALILIMHNNFEALSEVLLYGETNLKYLIKYTQLYNFQK